MKKKMKPMSKMEKKDMKQDMDMMKKEMSKKPMNKKSMKKK